MIDEIRAVFQAHLTTGLRQAVLSNPVGGEVTRLKLRPVAVKGSLRVQAEELRGTQVFHKNYTAEEVLAQLEDWFVGGFRQALLQTDAEEITILVGKKGKNARIVTKKRGGQGGAEGSDGKAVTAPIQLLSHNRVKQYLLQDGVPVPFLVALGVMTAKGQVVHARYDKFRQINRFLEFVSDCMPLLNRRAAQGRPLRVIDFGCGKSYLTFALYDFLHERCGLPVHITGLDLKADVIADCAALAKRCGYTELEFLQGDIAGYEQTGDVDMVVSLHACDTATDAALKKAVGWKAGVILCVPCCQHELNRQLQCDALQNILKYGLLKERMAALLTDGMRANWLEEQGYRVQVMEFIDMAHTPKNILLRAVRRTGAGQPPSEEVVAERNALLEFLHAAPSIYQ